MDPSIRESVPIPLNMDRYELRARELELAQKQRMTSGAWRSSGYERMQTFLIERYRRISATHKG